MNPSPLVIIGPGPYTVSYFVCEEREPTGLALWIRRIVDGIGRL